MNYRPELERCFRVVKVKNGKEYQVWPKGRPRRKASGKYLPRPDHIKSGITKHPPGSAERIADLAQYYETQPEESAFDTDLAYDLVSLLDWSKRKEKSSNVRDTLRCETVQQRAELED